MNRHDRRAAKTIGHGRSIMNVVATPFVPPRARLRDMNRDDRRVYVAILCECAKAVLAASGDRAPVAWRMAASFHVLIREGLARLVMMEDGRFKVALPDNLKFDWVN